MAELDSRPVAAGNQSNLFRSQRSSLAAVPAFRTCRHGPGRRRRCRRSTAGSFRKRFPLGPRSDPSRATPEVSRAWNFIISYWSWSEVSRKHHKGVDLAKLLLVQFTTFSRDRLVPSLPYVKTLLLNWIILILGPSLVMSYWIGYKQSRHSYEYEPIQPLKSKKFSIFFKLLW